MKIISIIPAPNFMSGIWSYFDERGDICQLRCRVACLALVEEDGEQGILPVPYNFPQEKYFSLKPKNPIMWL